MTKHKWEMTNDMSHSSLNKTSAPSEKTKDIQTEEREQATHRTVFVFIARNYFGEYMVGKFIKSV